MDYHQFAAVLSTVAAILNSRPLSIRTTPDDDYLAISPRDVLLGRGGKMARNLDMEVELVMCLNDDENVSRMAEAQGRVVD